MQFGVSRVFMMPLGLGKPLLRAMSLLECENANGPR